MKTINTHIPSVIIFEPQKFEDNRGYFIETFQQQRYQAMGIHEHFVQDNLSRSKQGVLRGLHFQHPNAQGKLVRVTRGQVFDVAVDIRRNSPTFAKAVTVLLDDQNHRQMYIPPGFAHGFCVLSEWADFHYKCTAYYQQGTEHGLLWNTPEFNIEWPITTPLLSIKDQKHPTLSNISPDHLPQYEPNL